MITGVAFVPQAPALVPEIGRGLDAELGPVRAACRDALRRVAPPGTRVAIVSRDDGLTGYGLTGYGPSVDVDTDIDLDTVGEWLVRDALGPRNDIARATPYGVPDDLIPLRLHEDDDPVALVVVGDGSACRSEKAPGYLDPRAARGAAALAQTLRDGDGVGLHFPLLADDPSLLVAGVHAWAAVAWHTEAFEWDAELLYDDAPFGVGYFVAVWLRHDGRRAEH